MDRSGQGRSSVPDRRATPVRRAPGYRECAERRVDRRDRDDRAPAGAGVASAAGVADREPRPDDPPLRAESIQVVPGLPYEAEPSIGALRDRWVRCPALGLLLPS